MKTQVALILLTLTFGYSPIFPKEQDFMSDAAAVRLSFSGSPERTVEGTSTEIGLRQWTLITPLFYKKGDAWSFAAGLRYEGTDLEFSDATLLNESWLQSIDLPLLLMKEQSESLNWMLLFNPTMAGDYDSIDGDTFNYLTIIGARYRTSETFQWFFGAVHTTGYDDNLFLPAIGFHWEASKNADLLFAGPYLRYKYSITDSLDFILGGRFSGSKWNTSSNYGERDFRLKAYRTSATLQWSIHEKHAVLASFGWEFAREVEIKASDDTLILERDLDHAPYYEIAYRFRF
ncbi:MAG: DUF6268 family outer membrane beta-barrel protein [Verrucomicrobia bacterium]|jgi:hypothetical protein|nr:hypothetical protein [Verrucomicrobiota bacterium]MDA0722893.1 DUF6268 family outer membrane beta-barrel protein [Verrucomicrobiota bacterium]MDA1047653.1 DUF6268 family outer membrane beta-barrel protein [Verrucomicrobiota bacterium]